MDLRIVNTCNSNCMYCLEQEYRSKKGSMCLEDIFSSLRKRSQNDTSLTFYGGNPLLHEDLRSIIRFSKTIGFQDIWILSNTLWLTRTLLWFLIDDWLNNFGIYFNSFSSQLHTLVTQNSSPLDTLLKNFRMISQSGIYFKVIIYINGLNIDRLHKDIENLHKYFSVHTIEFINYFPFDRAYRYNSLLWYNVDKKRFSIDKLLITIQRIPIKVSFSKFSIDFFWDFSHFYFQQSNISELTSDQDRARIAQDNPYCFVERRCTYCFIKDNCRHYDSLS